MKNIMESHQKKSTGRTYIGGNLVKERIIIDKDGNQIDPKTKEVITPQK